MGITNITDRVIEVTKESNNILNETKIADKEAKELTEEVNKFII